MTSCDIYNWMPSNPIVIRARHNTTWVPAERTPDGFRAYASRELRLALDRRTDELALAAAELGAAVFVYHVSFLDATPASPGEAGGRTGQSKDRPAPIVNGSAELRREAASHREVMYSRWFHPYWRPLDQLVGYALDTFQVCAVIDLTWCRDRPLPHERDEDRPNPEVLIGVRQYHSPMWLIRLAEDSCRNLGLTPVPDEGGSFAGGPYVPTGPHIRNPRVVSVELKVRDDIYLGDRSAQPSYPGDRMIELVTALVVGAEQRTRRGSGSCPA